jgi:hypothetical protein
MNRNNSPHYRSAGDVTIKQIIPAIPCPSMMKEPTDCLFGNLDVDVSDGIVCASFVPFFASFLVSLR